MACSDDSNGGDASGARAAYERAKSDEINARTAYERAKKQRDLDQQQGRLAVNNAHMSVVQEQNSLRSAQTDRPSKISAQAAAVTAQQALVAQAQRDVDETVLYAPAAGTSLAPGSSAPIPKVGAPATSDQSGNSTAGTLSATSPGGKAFIVLTDINSFQVVVPLQESDAAKVTPHQNVRVTFDAIPGLERDGTVLSVAPSGVNVSGVTNYYATILLTQIDPRMKDGQTAQAAVLITSMDDVLVVPNEYVVHKDGSSYVNVPGADGKPWLQQFQPGAVGDTNTQVLSGLAEGQPILPPPDSADAPGG
jgi:HlyD family secretion protein